MKQIINQQKSIILDLKIIASSFIAEDNFINLFSI